MKLQVLNSQIDPSVNFVEKQLVGFLESRFVRKCDEYFIAYLSSQTGCNRGCTFCHLTATHQTSFVDSSHDEMLRQAQQILDYYYSQKNPARYVHYNFMARGEPLANDNILCAADELFLKLGTLAKSKGLLSKFNISTIMPLTLKYPLTTIFRYVTPTIYYSLYSTNPEWRKKWMPGAMDVQTALDLIKEYQDVSKKIVKIHFPFISNENDSVDDINSMCDLIEKINLICEFNLVRYNPFSENQGTESSEEVIKNNIEIIKNRFKFSTKVQIIPRVGFDVKASCGMFV